MDLREVIEEVPRVSLILYGYRLRDQFPSPELSAFFFNLKKTLEDLIGPNIVIRIASHITPMEPGNSLPALRKATEQLMKDINECKEQFHMFGLADSAVSTAMDKVNKSLRQFETELSHALCYEIRILRIYS
jgi:hypothetical protein